MPTDYMYHFSVLAKSTHGKIVRGFLIPSAENKTGTEISYYVVEPPDYMHSIYDAADCPIEVRPDTICRCLGIKDYNGELIYNHDIVVDSRKFVYHIIFKTYSDHIRSDKALMGVYKLDLPAEFLESESDKVIRIGNAYDSEFQKVAGDILAPVVW